jgi:spore photoproduct lyase
MISPTNSANEHAQSDVLHSLVNSIVDVETIYHEPSVPAIPRGQQILARFPDAKRIEVPSHWNIPELHGNPEAVEEWVPTKKHVLVLGTKKSLSCMAYERSADWVAPSHANGCAMSCAYCYVARRKGFANPITTFVNIEQMLKYIERHALKQGMKLTPNATDPRYWVYELGTNSDCSVDAAICDNVRDLVDLFSRLPNAKATFATKFVNRDLLNYNPQGRTRIRFSLMPQNIARITDVRTSPIADRIAAVNDFVAAGYEVNLNFAPIIVYDGWLEDYRCLFQQVDDVLNADAKAQLAAEVIFLTHNAQLHEINMQWHPKAEALLWRPDLQETKVSGNGAHNLRYQLSEKRDFVAAIRQLMGEIIPYCAIRYAF